MMNLAQMLNRLHSDLKSPDQNRYPLSLMKEYFDEAEREINKRTKLIRSSTILDSVADQSTYDKPTDLLDWSIDKIYYSVTTSSYRRRLVPITIEKLNNINRNWREHTGSPVYWYIDKENDKYGFYPYETSVHTGTDCIQLKYRAKHTKMTTYYITGTVDVTNGSTAVAGNSTAFIGNVVSGNELGIGKLLSRTTDFPTTFFALSATPVSDTVLAIASYTGATASAQNYIISSVSSIENDTLNMACVLYAMGLCKGKDRDLQSKSSYMSEAIGRVEAELYRLETDVASANEASVPDRAMPYPASSGDDY